MIILNNQEKYKTSIDRNKHSMPTSEDDDNIEEHPTNKNFYLQLSFKPQKLNETSDTMGPFVLHQKRASVTPDRHGLQSCTLQKMHIVIYTKLINYKAAIIAFDAAQLHNY